ncbi:MAG: ABC transporter ATP-binding protein [Gammaproteobacteria bacterium]|nr:ABC transporter ATP-binding protein [Gammaproteobacteria bacterium]
MTSDRPRPPAEGDDVLISIRGLYFRRGERVIFDGVDMDIRRGAVTAIMGPSGTGKTTLLKLISAQLLPDAGTIQVEGRNIHALSDDELFDLRKRMGMLFQSGALLTDLTVFENVAYPLREHTELPETMIRQLVLAKLHAVGLRGAAGLLPAELSGGMARRVALARAIALDPILIMYDEPFSGQDPISVGVLAKLIKTMNDNLGLSSIIVSHDVAETGAISDYVYVIAEGRIMDHGTYNQLGATRSEWTRQFLNGLPDGPVHFHYPAREYAADLFRD